MWLFYNNFFINPCLQLSSIPELNTITTSPAENPPESTEVSPTKPTEEPPTPTTTAALEEKEPEALSQTVEVVEDKHTHPEYARFVKMVQVGVPLQAVKLKLQLEGLDPNVLEEVLRK